MEILITICGRGGSKRLSGKNTKEISGKPLVEYTFDAAKIIAKKLNADIAISSDDNKILNIAAKNSLSTDYLRPEYLASDTCGKIDVIKDILLYSENQNQKKYDFVIDLDITSPLRRSEEVVTAFKMLNNDKEAFNIFSVSKPYRNPYFNMTERKINGYFGIVCDKSEFLTTQAAPEVYDLNASFYIYRKSFFDKGFKTAFSPKSLVFVSENICFDIDNIEDFEYMEFLIKNNKFIF